MSGTVDRGRPRLTGADFRANDWSGDDNNGADYELIIDNFQYCFQEHDDHLLLVGTGELDSTGFNGHPDVHEQTIPAEVLDIFTGSTLHKMQSTAVPDAEAEPAVIRGAVQTECGAAMLLIEDPAQPDGVWKSAEGVIRELCTGRLTLTVDAATDSAVPAISVEGDDDSLYVSYETGDRETTVRFDRIDPDKVRVAAEKAVCAVELSEDGDATRIFAVPDIVSEVVEAHGYTILSASRVVGLQK
jgi:hypothetical protein